MPRSRMVRPETFSDEKLATISREARYLFIGLWVTSDDYGVTKGHPAWLRSQIFPYDPDVTIPQLEGWLKELSDITRIIPFTADREVYYNIPNFLRHQKIHNPSQLRNPTLASGSQVNTEKIRAPRVETESETETKSETETILSGLPDAAIPYREIVGHLNEVTGKQYKYISRNTRDLIRDR